MKLAAKLVLIGAGIAGAVLYDARRRRDRKPQPRTPDPEPASGRAGTDPRPSADTMVPPGISTVDPQPLTQISAEAIDPDATQAAHEAVVEQRDRLPVPGKNIL